MAGRMLSRGLARGVALGSLLLLSACVRLVPEGTPPRTALPATPETPVVESASFAGVTPGPSIGALGISALDAGNALGSFRESCPQLTKRTDASGLTSSGDWQPACEAALRWPVGRATEFFQGYFETARVGDGSAFATGYFEPEIMGCRTRRPGCETPVYGMPPELVRAWPADMPESERTGRPPLGRYDASGNFV